MVLFLFIHTEKCNTHKNKIYIQLKLINCIDMQISKKKDIKPTKEDKE